MTTATLITNVRISCSSLGLSPVEGSVLIEAGRIAAVYDDPHPQQTNVEAIDGGGRDLTPGLVDLHTHGIGHFLYERDGQEMIDAAKTLAKHGTTCILPTLYTCMKRGEYEHLRNLTAALDDVQGVSMPGFHLEGPFLKLAGAGADTFDGDVKFLDELINACAGKITSMSISPDTKNIMPVIDRLVEENITVFITHTKAGAEEGEEAIRRGASHATHFYDVFYSPDEYEPGTRPVGVVEAILAESKCTVDFICDGVHVKPLAIKAWVNAKGYDNVVIITDSNIGAGLEPGVHDTHWGFPIRIKDNDAARIHLPGEERDGLLAGSCLTMDRGINNVLSWLDLPFEQVIAMASTNPARVCGLQNKGKIQKDADADLVLWDRDANNNYTVARTWSMGQSVYEAS